MLAHMTGLKDLSPQDQQDILTAENAYRQKGMAPKDAAIKALQELRQIVQGELDGHHNELRKRMGGDSNG